MLWRVKASQIGTATLLAKALTNEEIGCAGDHVPGGAGRACQNDQWRGDDGAMRDGAEQHATVNFPSNTDAAAHGLHVEVSPSIAGSLFSALDYLTSYPYGCTEQTMSSFLPNVIVAETLEKLELTGLINKADLDAKVQAGLRGWRIINTMTADGDGGRKTRAACS